MWPTGLPTADGIISSVRYLFRVYAAARDSSRKFEAASQILQSIDLTLCILERLTPQDDSELEATLTFQAEVAREAWRDLEQYLIRFKPALDPQKDSSAASKCKKTIQWVLDDLDSKVQQLEDQVTICLNPILLTSSLEMLQQLSSIRGELALLKAVSVTAETPTQDQSNDEATTASDSTVAVAHSECWKRKGGCPCHCHSTRRITFRKHNHCFLDLLGLKSICRPCDVGGCTRRDGLEFRVAASGLGIPLAFVLRIELQSLWILKVMWSAETAVVKFTSPGFRVLEELLNKPLLPARTGESANWTQNEKLYDAAIWQKVAKIKYLFASRQITFRDVDPSGESWLEKVLRAPWPVRLREAQWDLVRYLVLNSPKDVLENPKLLYRCAKWIGEGPHMHMLETLLALKIDPEFLDASLFTTKWPRFCSPGWLSEEITEDPMFVDYVRKCLQVTPGFAGCDMLTECLLTGTESEFEQALLNETTKGGMLRNPFNDLRQTTIHLAVCFPGRLRKLLQAGMDADAVDGGGSTPLMYAACYGYSDAVLCLMRYGANPCVIDERNGRMFLDYAIRRNHLHVIREVVSMLRSEGHNGDAMAVLDRCLRYYFGSGSHIHDLYSDNLKHLFKLGADADVLNGTSSMLHLAVFDLEARIILNAGFTNVNSRDIEGQTTLMKVISRFDLRSARALVERGATVDCRDDRGWSALHHLMHAWRSIERYALAHDQGDETFARSVRAIACIQYLTSVGGDVSCRDSCECACSARGCSAITIALHETIRNIGDVFAPLHISGSLVHLLCVLQDRIPASLRQFLTDLTRYRQFVESGLEHSCCFGSTDSLHVFTKDIQTYDTEHAAFDAAFEQTTALAADSCSEVIAELGKLFHLLEEKSVECRNDAISIKNRSNHQPLERFQVDEKNDEYRIVYDFSMLPPLSKLDIVDQKRWLANRARIEKMGGLHLRGDLQSYLEHCSQIWDKVETVMQNLHPNVTLQ